MPWPRCVKTWPPKSPNSNAGGRRAKTPLRSGAPSKACACKQKKTCSAVGAGVADLFTHRHLFVKHHLTEAERQLLHTITRGLPHLRTLRENAQSGAFMDEVYRLFDRRCRTETALVKLAHLRARVQRFQKVGQTLQPLFSSNLEKALTFLDDRELPATSNAVERGNRRHRKMQKSIYRVRTQPISTGASHWTCCETPRRRPGGKRLARSTGPGRIPPAPLRLSR